MIINSKNLISAFAFLAMISLCFSLIICTDEPMCTKTYAIKYIDSQKQYKIQTVVAPCEKPFFNEQQRNENGVIVTCFCIEDSVIIKNYRKILSY